MKEYFFTFDFDARGFGNIELRNDSLIALSVPARTGSINGSGDLVNAIFRDSWYIREPSQLTDETAMVITPGKGWKVRLWRKYGDKYWFTHFLIHPDGNKPGSLGCLATKGDALDLRDRIDQILQKQKVIRVYINQKPEEFV